ncbi:pheromone processing endoprotease, variant 2 [Basidiobolus ranarum]
MWLFTSLLPFALLSYNIVEASLPTWYTTRRHDNYNHYAIKINEFITPTEVSNLLDLEYVGSLDSLEGYHLFTTHKNNPVQVETFLHNTLHKRQNHPSRHIKHIYKESLRKRTKRAPIPPQKNHTDSQVHQVFDIAELKDPGFPKQWHLHNEDNVGNDLNILKVWQQGIFGNNVVVALLDDGLDMNSEDLKDNYFAEGSYDFNDHSPVPSPKLSDDYHGTRCAGEIAAANNSVCGVGVAFGSKVSGIRILSDTISDLDEALALVYENQKNHIYSCSWGPSDDGSSMDGPSEMINDALVSGVTKGRGEKGSIFVFATGNGGAYNDNCNFDGYANSIYTISIGAIDRHDQQPNYSEQCSAQLAVTYSSGANGEGIYTTDVGQNKCTGTHGGTSAAAPLAAGIFALVLSVRPDLHWRDIQHLAVRTAQPFSPNDPDWKSTVSGRKFNHKYGYGKLDAYRIVEASKTYDSVGPQVQFSSGLLKVDQPIPSDSTGIRQSFTVSTETAQNHFLNLLEHVTVTVDISHQRRGDVEVYLTSPNNVTSVLSPGRQLDESEEGFKNWTFMSVKHW